MVHVPKSSESGRKKVGMGAYMPGLSDLEMLGWDEPFVWEPLIPLVAIWIQFNESMSREKRRERKTLYSA